MSQIVDQTWVADQVHAAAEQVEKVTASVVTPIVRRKLHVSLQAADASARNQDALELVSEIRILLLAGLVRGPLDIDESVRDLTGYAAVVAANVCYQYFRSKFPIRTREANRLRYLLRHREEFDIWKDDRDRWLCGRSDWKDERASAAVPEVVDAARVLRGKAEREKHEAILEWVFEVTGAPVAFDELVASVMSALDLRDSAEQEDVSAMVERLPDPRPAADDEIVSAERLGGLWRAVLELPLKQRKVLLLNLKDRSGSGLIALLPLTGTASIREIAEALAFSAAEFAVIWNSLPWDDLRVAEHLGLSRQQVINLRQSARAKLLRQLRGKGNIGE